MNWKMFTLVSLIIGAFCVTSAMAIDGGNPRKGKYLFKKNCKSCHSEGAEGGEIVPKTKISSRWDSYFEEGKAEHPGDIFKKLSDKDLKDINQFLFDNAADMPGEETCG